MVQKTLSGELFIDTEILRCELELEYSNPIFLQDASASDDDVS